MSPVLYQLSYRDNKHLKPGDYEGCPQNNEGQFSDNLALWIPRIASLALFAFHVIFESPLLCSAHRFANIFHSRRLLVGQTVFLIFEYLPEHRALSKQLTEVLLRFYRPDSEVVEIEPWETV